MKDEQARTSLTYDAAGVDIASGNELVERIKPAVQSTYRRGVLGGIGGFGGLFELPWSDYQAPVLVSGTDGVGTKLRLAIDLGLHDHIGVDLVAMCVNDIIVTGAEPLFFLDYFATGKLDVEQGVDIVNGIARGCIQAGAALVGGESAEMPGLYSDGDYDLAGFAVGLVEKNDILDGSQVTAGDVIIGLASSGPHSNGFSLIRSVVEHAGASLDKPFGESNRTLGDVLLEPTRIYVKSLLEVQRQRKPFKALAHITGGGLLENIPRVLPTAHQAVLNPSAWEQPEIFTWLQSQGNIETMEMYRVFNCGIGMVAIVDSASADAIVNELSQLGEDARIIGHVEKNPDPEHSPVVRFD